MSKSNKRKTTIKPFNKHAHAEIRAFFKIFAYGFSEFTSVKIRNSDGTLKRDEFGSVVTKKTPPYFALYAIGNLNKRTIQSIAARINRKYRRLAS